MNRGGVCVRWVGRGLNVALHPIVTGVECEGEGRGWIERAEGGREGWREGGRGRVGQCNLDQLNYPEYRGLVRSGLVYSQCARWRGGQRVGTLAERKRIR